MKKIIVCLTGVVNRSIKYTWDSINDNIIDELKKEYDVHIAIFNNNVEDCLVDGVKINNNDMSIIPYDFLFEYKQTFIDSEIVKIEGYDKEFPPCWFGIIKKNGFRLMYIESKIANFLEENKDKYKYALISNADYLFLNKINLKSIKNLAINNIVTCHHLDFNGITDGFYLGNLEYIIKLMKRIQIYNKIPKPIFNYEVLVKLIFIYYNIQRFKIDLYFVKLRATLCSTWPTMEDLERHYKLKTKLIEYCNKNEKVKHLL